MSMRYSCWQHFLTCFKCLSGTDSSETTAVTLKWHGIGVKIHLFLSSRVLRVAKELQDKKQCVFYQHLLQSPKMMRKTTCTLSVALHVVLKSEQAMIRSALQCFFFSPQLFSHPQNSRTGEYKSMLCHFKVTAFVSRNLVPEHPKTHLTPTPIIPSSVTKLSPHSLVLLVSGCCTLVFFQSVTPPAFI